MELELQLESAMKLIGDFILLKRTNLRIGKKKFGQLCGGLSETYIRMLEGGKANITIESLVKIKSGINSTIAIIITANQKRFSSKTLSIGRKEDFSGAKQNFSLRLRKLIEHRGILSSLQFSNYLGMDESATNKYLKGEENPTYLMLLRFAYVLDVAVVDFFDYEGALPDKPNYKLRYLNP